MSPASPDKQPIEIEVLSKRRQPDQSEKRQADDDVLQYDGEWGIAAAFFFCVNAAIVAAVLVSGAQRQEGWLDLCLFYQATVLGIWLGAGSSRFWIRGFVFALSYYYACLFFSATAFYAHEQLCDVGAWVLLTALISLTLRTILNWRTLPPISWRFSLGQLINFVTGCMVVIAVWSRPVGLLFHAPLAPFAPFLRFMPIALLAQAAVVPIAFPSFLRSPWWRVRAYGASLTLQFALYMLWYAGGTDVQGSRLIQLAPAAVIAILAAALLCYLIFAAEAALALFGIDFAHPGAPRRRPPFRRSVRNIAGRRTRRDGCW